MATVLQGHVNAVTSKQNPSPKKERLEKKKGKKKTATKQSMDDSGCCCECTQQYACCPGCWECEEAEINYDAADAAPHTSVIITCWCALHLPPPLIFYRSQFLKWFAVILNPLLCCPNLGRPDSKLEQLKSNVLSQLHRLSAPLPLFGNEELVFESNRPHASNTSRHASGMRPILLQSQTRTHTCTHTPTESRALHCY